MSVVTRRRLAVAVTVWALLQAATMVVAAVRGGTPEDAFAFFVTGLVTLVLAAAAGRLWASAPRFQPWSPPEPEDDDAPVRHHVGLSGEQPPPVRW